MPRNHEWCSRISAIASEYLAARQAIDRFHDEAHRDPTIRRRDVQYRFIEDASNNLNGTYLIRLFAEFETGLRRYWEEARGTKPPTRDLLEGLAAMRSVPDELKDNVHAVREYRNSLVHEREEAVEEISVEEASGSLCHFFSFLPPQW